jgi:hypothetical protein
MYFLDNATGHESSGKLLANEAISAELNFLICSSIILAVALARMNPFKEELNQQVDETCPRPRGVEQFIVVEVL